MTGPEALPALADTQAEIERLLLWDIIKDTLRGNAFSVGIQPVYQIGAKAPADMLVLASLANNGPDTEDPSSDLYLWGRWDAEAKIVDAHIIYTTARTMREEWNYHIGPTGMRQYAANAVRETALDQDDLQDMRADIEEALWDAARAQKVASDDIIFFSD